MSNLRKYRLSLNDGSLGIVYKLAKKNISDLLLLHMIDFWFEQTQAEKQSVKTWVEGRIVAN